MVNLALFNTLRGRRAPATDAVNREGAPAYAFTPKHALAQFAATGCLNATFYASAESQLDTVLKLAANLDGDFVARTAVYAREHAFMKDMPALLCAALADTGRPQADIRLLERIFPRVIDNSRMLRTFVQIMRSGAVGRKSLGSAPKRMVRSWLAARTETQLFYASVGQSPSLADIVKMVHPTPATPERAAFYGYLLGREHDAALLPEVVRDFERFKRDPSVPVPDVPFQMLTALDLDREAWAAIARRATWQTTRMNLNTFARHGVFDVEGLTDLIAERLRDRQAMQRARVFPYQLLVAFTQASSGVPEPVRAALQDAMEIAVENVPEIEGRVVVCPDVSGSMHSPVTGYRRGATSAVRCVDVASLVTAAVLRTNPSATVLPFENRVVSVRLNPRDSVMTNATRLASVGGGGTNCSAPLARLNKQRAQADLVLFVSDNQSWVDAQWGGGGTAMLREWNALKQRNPRARLVCLDVQPYRTSQVTDGEDILNVGGFSDRVFDVIARFAEHGLDSNHWVGEIERVEL